MQIVTLQIVCLLAGQVATQPVPEHSVLQPPAPRTFSVGDPPATPFRPSAATTADPPQRTDSSLDFGATPPSPQGFRAGDSSEVAPAAYSATAPPADRSTELATFCRVTEEDIPAESRGKERTVTLADLLSAAATPSDRLRAVQAYWNLAAATGRYQFALLEERQLQDAARRGAQSYPVPQISAELAIAKAARQLAQLQLLEQQERLNRSFLQITGDRLPWPADAPFVGPYRTEFETIFGTQPTPSRLREIDRALPQMAEHVKLRADAISAAELALNNLSPSTHVESWLAMSRRLSEQRRQFLAALIDYNQRIAEYSLSVTGPATPVEALVATLIRRSDSGLVAVQPRDGVR